MDSSSSLLKAPAVATVLAVLAATAEAAPGSYIPTIDAAGFFLWVALNAIVLVIWLLSSSSSRRGRIDDDGDDSSSSWAASGHDAVDSSFYTSASEYEAFSDASRSAAARRAVVDAPEASRRLPRDREAKAARRADRPRVRKKPAAGHDLVAPSHQRAAVLAAAVREPDDEIRRNREATLAAFAATAAEEASSRPGGGGGGGADDDEDVSMDSLWESIVQRRAARPVVVRKSESWGNEELPRLKRVAATAAARREIRKSVSAVSDTASSSLAPPRPPPSSQSAAEEEPRQQAAGWRTRDVLVAISPDELLRRAESFIRRQREHLRLQRQESEQRQLQLQRRLHAPALIRV